MNVLQRGDRLVVSELSRLGRSLGQIVAILDALAKARSSGRKLGRPERLAGRLTVQRQGGRHPALPRGFEVRRVESAKKMVELYRAGQRQRQIAVVVGCGLATVSRELRKPLSI